MDEWTHDTRDFATRVANLSGVGTGPRLNESVFLSVEGPGATVFHDGARDLLTGSSGMDWFLFDSEEDKVTDLSDEEFARYRPGLHLQRGVVVVPPIRVPRLAVEWIDHHPRLSTTASRVKRPTTRKGGRKDRSSPLRTAWNLRRAHPI